MSWPIAKRGKVLLAENELELAEYSEVLFNVDRLYAPDDELTEALRAHLAGAKGYFRMDGKAPDTLLAAVKAGKTLIVRCEMCGHSWDVEVTVDGKPPELHTAAPVFPFTVQNVFPYVIESVQEPRAGPPGPT